MNKSIYREEARQALKVQLEGEVVALAPPSIRKLTLLFGIGVLVTVVFGSTATYTRYASATGTLVPREGLVTVSAPLKGDVIQIMGKQGQVVSAGQPLALLRNTQAQAMGAESYSRDRELLASRKNIARDLHLAKEQELQLSLSAAILRAEGINRTLKAARASADTAAIRVKSSQSHLERQRTLVDKGYLARAGLTQAEQAYLGDVQTYLQAEQSVASLAAELVSAEQAVLQTKGQLKTLSAQTKDSTIVLDMEASRLSAASEAVVSSALAGTIAAVPALNGPVEAGAPLFVVAPPGPLYARLMLNEASAQKAKVGQAVTLRVLSRTREDSRKIEGTITSLAAAPITVKGESGTEPVYLAWVFLKDQNAARDLPLGARVDARLAIASKSLAGWLYDPLARGLRQANFLEQ